MTINLTVPHTMQELRPRITVIGVGGAGCNAVNNMITGDLDGVDFLVANTDGQALAHSLAPRKIQLGSNLTAGLGAGSKPDIGRQAAEESMNEVLAELSDCNMVFITAGMGGGTGTGAAPVIAKAARERGILTVGVVTKPFQFEGPRRMKQAEAGIEQLAAHVDTLIVVPNQNLFHVTNERTTFADAFHMADTVLYQGVCGVTDLMLKPGIINLDFADIRSVMTEMGKAMMGTGEASGEGRAITAAETAINNPLLEDTSLRGAKALIVNVTGGPELGFFEVDEAVQRIRNEVDEDANLIFGSAIDDTLDGTIRVSVVATGIDANAYSQPAPHYQAPATPSSLGSSDLRMPSDAPVAAAPAAPIMAEEETMPAAPSEDDAPVLASDDMTTDSIVELDDIAGETEVDVAPHSEPAIEDQTDIADTQLDLETAVAETTVTETAEPTLALDDADITDEAPIARIEDESVTATPLAEDTFIPAAPLSVEPDPVLAAAAPVPQSRPSLIHKISGLWAPRKADESEAPAQEPKAMPEEPKILDLPRGDAVQESLPIGANTAASAADDELDIPAFLRRQAN